MTDLQNVVKYNSACYKEAYDYCLYISFPETAGDIASKQKGINGATACSAVLLSSQTYNGIARPILSIIWTMLVANPVILLLMAIIVLIAIVVAAKRR
jgi:hypothetical protein